MSKAARKEQKIRQNPKNVSLADFEWLINRYGNTEGGGNHAIARIGNIRYAYPRTNQVGKAYVEELLKIIDNHKV